MSRAWWDVDSMPRIILTIILIWVGTVAAGDGILLVLNDRDLSVDATELGLIQSFRSDNVVQMEFSDSGQSGTFLGLYLPKVIVTIGLRSLSMVREVAENPIVYAMILSPPEKSPSITGVRMTLPAPEAAALLKARGARRVSTVTSQNTLYLARELDVVRRYAQVPGETLGAVEQAMRAAGPGAVFWMFSDSAI